MEKLQDYYWLCILRLLSPWRDMSNLSQPNESLKQAFKCFMTKADYQTQKIIDNVQYQYECTNSTARKHAEHGQNKTMAIIDLERDNVKPSSTAHQQQMDEVLQNMNFIQWDVDNKMPTQFSGEEKLFTKITLNITQDYHIFTEDQTKPKWNNIAKVTSDDNMADYQLQKLVMSVMQNRITANKRADIQPNNLGSPEEVSMGA